MPPSSIQYTKQRWLLTIAGLFLYVADTCSDVGLALKYYQEKHFVWTGLTLVFVLAGVLVTQIFSYVWYRDDMNGPLGITEGGPNISGTSTGRLAVLHLFGMGIFTRYDIVWLLATIWMHVLQTNFCSSSRLELLYRAVIGVILTFTFFNVKGQDTKVAMIIYYLFYVIINIIAPSLLALLKPELQTATFLLTVGGLIFGGSVLGLVCLVLYYLLLHPRENWRETDEVDGLWNQKEDIALLHL